MFKNLAYYAGYIEIDNGKEYITGRHEALISESVYRSIKSKTNMFYRNHRSVKTTVNYPFAAVLTCEECSSIMYGSTSSSRNKLYSYYTCSNKECKYFKRRGIKAAYLEKSFFELLQIQLNELPFVEQVPDLLDEVWIGHTKQMDINHGRLSSNIKTLNKDIDYAINVIGKTKIPELIERSEKQSQQLMNKEAEFKMERNDGGFISSYR